MLLGIKGATKPPDTGLAGCLSLRPVKQRYSVMLTPAGLRKWVLSGEDWAEIRDLHRAEHMAHINVRSQRRFRMPKLISRLERSRTLSAL
jgi:hypothetical protein